jgi:DNA (cytosine-5)-methyltransferase 1
VILIHNHYGYGLRNDEKPFAHKIPSGGNWKCLSREDQIAFMKGALNSGGGQTMYLRRLSWDEPALSIIASPMGKATCQLHPGAKDWEDDEMVANHDKLPISAYRQYKTFDSANDGAPWDQPSWTIRSGTITGQPWHPNKYGPKSEEGDILQKPLLDALPKQPPTGLTSIELFAGGGLMRLGIEWAGIRTIWANDFDKNAVRAHKHNFGEDSIVLGDITQIPIEEIPDADIIVGGPPCQDYSVAGKGEGEKGERGKLVWRYLDIIDAKQPKAFLFENVKGLITKRHRPTFDALLQKFDEIGYNVSWKLVNAWDYGVAQKRERVFIVGIRKDIGITYEFPPSEYETTGYRPVLRDAIGDLPEPGVSLTDIQQAFLDRNPVSVAKNRPVTFDEPSRTIPAVMHKGVPYGLFIPNDEPKPRRFTVRETLRIQSVPDTYIFPDDMSLSAMYRIVGNGVPSRLAYHIAKSLSEQLLHIGRAGTQ